MPSWPTVTVTYGSGPRIYHPCGFLLADVLAGREIIIVRYCDAADTGFQRLYNFDCSKIISEFVDVFCYMYGSPFRKEVYQRPVRMPSKRLVGSCYLWGEM